MAQAANAPFGSVCAIHAERTATLTCTRCGNFMCAECSVNATSPICPSCRELGQSPFPFTRTNFDFSSVWDYVFKAWQRDVWLLVVCGLIVFGVGMIGSFVGMFFNVFAQGIGAVAGKGHEIFAVGLMLLGQFVSILLSTLLQGIGLMGLVRVCIDVLEGRKPDPQRMFTQLPKAWNYLLQQLIIIAGFALPLMMYFGLLGLASVAISSGGLSEQGLRHMFEQPGAGLLLFGAGTLVIIPVIVYLALPLTFASMELVYGEVGAVEAIRRSWILIDGFRLTTFGYALVGSLVLIAGLLVCCVGMLAAFPLQYLLMVALYLSLRNGSSLPPPVGA